MIYGILLKTCINHFRNVLRLYFVMVGTMALICFQILGLGHDLYLDHQRQVYARQLFPLHAIAPPSGTGVFSVQRVADLQPGLPSDVVCGPAIIGEQLLEFSTSHGSQTLPVCLVGASRTGHYFIPDIEGLLGRDDLFDDHGAPTAFVSRSLFLKLKPILDEDAMLVLSIPGQTREGKSDECLPVRIAGSFGPDAMPDFLVTSLSLAQTISGMEGCADLIGFAGKGLERNKHLLTSRFSVHWSLWEAGNKLRSHAYFFGTSKHFAFNISMLLVGILVLVVLAVFAFDSPKTPTLFIGAISLGRRFWISVTATALVTLPALFPVVILMVTQKQHVVFWVPLVFAAPVCWLSFWLASSVVLYYRPRDLV